MLRPYHRLAFFSFHSLVCALCTAPRYYILFYCRQGIGVRKFWRKCESPLSIGSSLGMEGVHHLMFLPMQPLCCPQRMGLNPRGKWHCAWLHYALLLTQQLVVAAVVVV